MNRGGDGTEKVLSAKKIRASRMQIDESMMMSSPDEDGCKGGAECLLELFTDLWR